MKYLRRVLLILFLVTTLAYVANITGIPNNIVLFKGEELNLGEIFGIYIKEEDKNDKTVQTFSTLNDIEIIEKSTLKLKLFNIVELKTIEVNTIPRAKVVPLGNTVRT